MARIVWGKFGERFYDVGIDRGVLYVAGAGVAWHGLVSVAESPTGGDPQPVYIDGVKVINVAAAEEFAATIEAFASPPEFAICDGTKAIQNGLMVTQQPRKQFSLSYRTLVGNDATGQDAYKIHIVYNALAGPSQRENSTIGDSVNLTKLSWSITTLPPVVSGFRPTAHFVIDSRSTPEELLASVEDILYGSEVADASLPSAADLIAMFTA